MYFEDIEIGMTASKTKTITDADIFGFAGISGDMNPMHLDDEYAEKHIFKSRVAHGLISAGLFSAILGMDLPGPGCLYTGQILNFRAPVFPGDTVTATVEILDKVEKGGRVFVQCTARVGNTVVVEGNGQVSVPKRSKNECDWGEPKGNEVW